MVQQQGNKQPRGNDLDAIPEDDILKKEEENNQEDTDSDDHELNRTADTLNSTLSLEEGTDDDEDASDEAILDADAEDVALDIDAASEAMVDPTFLAIYVGRDSKPYMSTLEWLEKPFPVLYDAVIHYAKTQKVGKPSHHGAPYISVHEAAPKKKTGKKKKKKEGWRVSDFRDDYSEMLQVRIDMDEDNYDKILRWSQCVPLPMIIDKDRPGAAAFLWRDAIRVGNMALANSIFVISRFVWNMPLHPTPALGHTNTMDAIASQYDIKLESIFPIIQVHTSGPIFEGEDVSSHHLLVGKGADDDIHGSNIVPWGNEFGGDDVVNLPTPKFIYTGYSITSIEPTDNFFAMDRYNLSELVERAVQRVQLQLTLFNNGDFSTADVGPSVSPAWGDDAVSLVGFERINERFHVGTYSVKYDHIYRHKANESSSELHICTVAQFEVYFPRGTAFEKLVDYTIDPTNEVLLTEEEIRWLHNPKCCPYLQFALKGCQSRVEAIKAYDEKGEYQGTSLQKGLSGLAWSDNIEASKLAHKHFH